MESLLDIAILIVSVALVATIVLQSKQAGLGGLGGAEMTTSFSTRRGLEKTLFQITIGLSIAFLAVCILAVFFNRL